MINEGYHTAKALDWALVNGYNDELSVRIIFSNVKDETATWTGTLENENYRQYTFDALRQCGFTGGKDELALLAKGPEAGALSTDAEVQIVIEHATDQKGKTWANVKYVNAPGGKFKNMITYDDAVRRLKGLDFNLASMTTATTQSQRPSNMKDNPSLGDDLPF